MKNFWSWHKQLQLLAVMDFEILLKSELPVTSLSDFLLFKYILKG